MIDSIIFQVKEEIYSEKTLYAANFDRQCNSSNSESNICRKRSYDTVFHVSL